MAKLKGTGNRPTTIERAFELAESGQFDRISQIQKVLSREGYGDARMHFDGSHFQKQLRAMIDDARIRCRRSKPSEDRPNNKKTGAVVDS